VDQAPKDSSTNPWGQEQLLLPAMFQQPLPPSSHDRCFSLVESYIDSYHWHTWCGRKVMRLATLCTNRQRCCPPFSWQLG